MAATVASISFVVPYANDQLCVSRTEYNDTHQPMKLLPAAQFYCEDGQLNDYVSPRDVALGCISSDGWKNLVVGRRCCSSSPPKTRSSCSSTAR